MKKVIFWGLILSILSCTAQEKATKVPLKKMEELNGQKIDNFHLLFLKDEINFTKPNGDEVRQIEDKNFYTEFIVKKGTPFETVNWFDKKTCTLRGTGERMYGFLIGVAKEYDQKGILIKETNNDEPFKFTIEALAQKVKEEFHIDVLKNTIGVYINRTTNPVPTYQLFYPVIEGNPRWSNILVFDGTTGSLTYKGTSKSVE